MSYLSDFIKSNDLEIEPFTLAENKLHQDDHTDPAATEHMTTTKDKPKIEHIVISGGGATGFSFFGALKKTQSSNLWNQADIKSIYATSSGAICAFLIALQIEWDVIIHYFIHRPWQNIFKMDSHLLDYFNKRGILGRNVFQEMFDPLLKCKGVSSNITMQELFDYSGIEIHCFSTEINSFSLVDISHKTHPDLTIIDVIYCSASLPILFQPFFINECVYVDGAILCNYPIYQCLHGQSANPDSILGIRISDAPLSIITTEYNLFDYLLQLFSSCIFRLGKLESKPINIKHEIVFKEYPDMISIMNVMADSQKRKDLVLFGEQMAELFLDSFKTLVQSNQDTTE